MKKLSAVILSLTFGSCLTVVSATAQQSPINLGSNYSFAVVAGTTVSVSGGGSITGNIAVFPGTTYVAGVPAVTVNGTVYVDRSTAAWAQVDLITAYYDTAARSVDVVTVAGNIGGRTLYPGLYRSTSSLEISSGDLTLDAHGNADSVFIFQVASTLTTTSGRRIILANSANPANIFWQVGGSATIGTTSLFYGTILADGSISMLSGSTLTGRALALKGAVTIDTGGGTSVTVPGYAPVPGPLPAVISTIPANRETGVSVGSTISATFNKQMYPLTISTATFTLEQGTTTISGTVEYAGTTATFSPLTPLSPRTVYAATITSGATDLAGAALPSSLWIFETSASGSSAPFIRPSSTVNNASYLSPVAAGSIVAVFGSDLALGQASSNVPTPLPFELAQGSIEIGGRPAPLFFAMPAQVNLQIPWELAGQEQASVIATVAGTTSNVQTVPLVPFAPGIFSMNMTGTGQGAILIANTAQLAAPGTAASRGRYVSIFCTGLGPVTNQPATGIAARAAPLSITTTTPTVTIGGVVATLNYSGLAPGLVGLYQVNAQVPLNVFPGNTVPVSISVGGAESNIVTIAVQ